MKTKQQKRNEADERNEAYGKLTLAQKVKRARSRGGEHTREYKRLAAQL